MIETHTDLLQVIQKLPAKVGFPQRSYKANWIRWLSKYQTKGGDRVNPHRGAEFIYTKINLPGWIVWLAAASGISPQLVHKAANAVDPKESRMTQAAAVRRVLPWSVIAKRLEDQVAPNSDEQARNPPWTRDELILALELYMRNHASPPSKSSVEVQELSATLNKLGVALGFAENNKFRNANGVYMKMMNFRRFDPEYTATGKVGLTRGNKDEEEVWREFSQDKERLISVAHAIRQAITLPSEGTLVDLDDEGITEAAEGRLLTRLHRRRERSRKLVQQRKLKALEELGRLRCEACSFDFEERYGSRGKGFIEAHHTKPVETLVEGSKTKLEDLALLCANCHRMVHATRPWLRVNELQHLLNKSSAVPTNK